jgi:hypothetical protein
MCRCMAGDTRGAKDMMLSILVFKSVGVINYVCVKEIVLEMYF